MYVYVYMYMYMYIYMYMYMCIYIYVSERVFSLFSCLFLGNGGAEGLGKQVHFQAQSCFVCFANTRLGLAWGEGWELDGLGPSQTSFLTCKS